jgi:hypothetical protein
VAITKADDIEQMVEGWASVSTAAGAAAPLVDLQGDSIEIDELQKAFCEYALNSRTLNFMHDGPVRGTLVEMMVFTPQRLEKLGLAPDAVPLGAFVSYHIPDAADYTKAKTDKLMAFSIEGVAVREEVA